MEIFVLRQKFAVTLSLGLLLCCSSVCSSALAQSWGQFKQAALTATEQKNLLQAEKFWQSALQLATEYGPRDPRFGASVSGLAAVYREQKRFSEAEALYKQVVCDIGSFRPGSPETNACAAEYVTFLNQQQRPAEAKALAALLPAETKRTVQDSTATAAQSPSVPTEDKAGSTLSGTVATQVLRTPVAEDSKWTAFTNSGKSFLKQKNYQSAEVAFKKALDQLETIPAGDMRVNQTFSNLTDLYLAWNRIADADMAHHGSLAWIRKFRGPMSQEHVAALLRHGKLLRSLNRKPEAIAEEGRAEKIQFAISGRPDQDANAFSSITSLTGTSGGSILGAMNMSAPSGGGGGDASSIAGGGGGYGASVGASAGRSG